MYIAQSVFLFLVVAIVLLAITLAVVVASYVILLTKLRKVENDRVRLDKQIREHATFLLDRAHKKAMLIINEAHGKAKEVLRTAREFTDSSKDHLASELDQVEKAQEEMIIDSGKEFRGIYEQFVSELEKNLEKDALAEVSTFKESLLQQTMTSQKEITEQMKQVAEEAEKEIQEYKAEKMKKIDERFVGILSMVGKEVLGNSFSLDEHRSLVMKGLKQVALEIKTDE